MDPAISLTGDVFLKQETGFNPVTHAVDLDGTLAEYHGWEGPEDIGDPILPMLKRVRDWLADGDRVVIFTARASIPGQIPPIQRWLSQQGLPELEITNTKTHEMTDFWDDRAVAVQSNTGKILGGNVNA